MLDLSSAVVFGWPIHNGIECVVSAGSPKAALSPPSRKLLDKRPPLNGLSNRSSVIDTHPSEHTLLRLDSLIQIICRGGDDEEEEDARDEWRDEFDDDPDREKSQVELILPKLMYRNNDAKEEGRWHSLFSVYDYVLPYEDDQWAAAKRGDLEALMSFAGVDWTKMDEFGSTALYYACHSGAARDIMVVQYLIHAWSGAIPIHVVDRCKKNAINVSVVHMLDNPDDDISSSRKQDDEIYNNALQCFAGWNIFEEEGDY